MASGSVQETSVLLCVYVTALYVQACRVSCFCALSDSKEVCETVQNGMKKIINCETCWSLSNYVQLINRCAHIMTKWCIINNSKCRAIVRQRCSIQWGRGWAQSWSSEVSWRQKFPECGSDLQLWLRWKDCFSAGMPEGRRVQTVEGVEESGQGRAMASLPQRREGLWSRRSWDSARLNHDLETLGVLCPWQPRRLTTAFWTVREQPPGASAVQIGREGGWGLCWRIYGGWRQAGLQHSEWMHKEPRGRKKCLCLKYSGRCRSGLTKRNTILSDVNLSHSKKLFGWSSLPLTRSRFCLWHDWKENKLKKMMLAKAASLICQHNENKMRKALYNATKM